MSHLATETTCDQAHVPTPANHGVKCTLPATMLEISGFRTRIVLKAAGVQFGDLLPDKKYLILATLPIGWSIEAVPDTERASFLLDCQGRPRARIYSNGTKSSMHFLRRYSVVFDHQTVRSHGEAVARVLDAGVEMHIPEGEIPVIEDVELYLSTGPHIEAARNHAKAWLTKNYPGWKNPHNHWD